MTPEKAHPIRSPFGRANLQENNEKLANGLRLTIMMSGPNDAEESRGEGGRGKTNSRNGWREWQWEVCMKRGDGDKDVENVKKIK